MHDYRNLKVRQQAHQLMIAFVQQLKSNHS